MFTYIGRHVKYLGYFSIRVFVFGYSYYFFLSIFEHRRFYRTGNCFRGGWLERITKTCNVHKKTLITMQYNIYKAAWG